MSHIRKVKSGSPITTFIPAIIAITLLALSSIFLGISTGIKVIGVVILAYGAISFGFYYLKTKSTIYLISSSYLLAFGFVLIFIRLEYDGNPAMVFPPISRLFGVWMILSWIWLFYMIVTNQTTWKGNRILELIALGVEPTNNAYTERPFPIGKADFSKEEILALAKFLQKNIISVYYNDNEKIYFVPTNNKAALSLLVRHEFNVIEDTWIAFDPEGEVTVHISRKSYLSYKENLALDQLCYNLGNLFIEFLEDYRKGEGVRVLDKINSVKSDFFA